MNRFVKNSSLFLLTSLVLNASSFLLLPFYTRLMSPDDMGNIYLLQTIAIIVGMISTLQMETSISRHYYDYRSEYKNVKKMYTTIILFVFLISTVVYGFLMIFHEMIFFFIDLKFFPYIFFVLLSSYLTNFYNLILSLLYVEEKAKNISLLSITIGIGSIILTIVFVISFKDKLLGYFLSKLVVSVLQFFIFVFYSKSYFIKIDNLFNIKEFFLFSIQRLPIGLSSWIVTFSDRFMVSGFINSYQNGIYSTGYKLGQIPDILYNAINKAYVPYVFDKYSDFTKTNHQKVSQIAQYIFTLYISVVFGIVVFSKEFIYLLDSRYSDSLGIMIIILLSYALNGIKLIFHCPMDFQKEYGKVKSIIWISSSLLNVVINIVLIPKFGIYGAAYATFISYLVTLIPILYFSNKAMKIRYNYIIFIKILIISCIYSLGVLLSISIVNLSIKLFLSIVYVFVILKTNDLQLIDIKLFIKSMKRKEKDYG